MRFGELLKNLIESRGIAKSALCRQLGVSRPYLYAIFSGDVVPPVADRQVQIADILGLERSERAIFFDAAADEREELPADIVAYYMRSLKNRNEFRKQRALEIHGTARRK